MNKAEFLRALDNALSNLPESERREHIEYYSELIDDMMEEEGLDEYGAVDRLDDVYAIAADINRTRACRQSAAQQARLGRCRRLRGGGAARGGGHIRRRSELARCGAGHRPGGGARGLGRLYVRP